MKLIKLVLIAVVAVSIGKTAEARIAYQYPTLSLQNSGFEDLKNFVWNLSGITNLSSQAQSGDRGLETLFGEGFASQTLQFENGLGSGFKWVGSIGMKADSVPPDYVVMSLFFYDQFNNLVHQVSHNFYSTSGVWETKPFSITGVTPWYKKVVIRFSVSAFIEVYLDNLVGNLFPIYFAKEVAPAPVLKDSIEGTDVSDGDSVEISK